MTMRIPTKLEQQFKTMNEGKNLSTSNSNDEYERYCDANEARNAFISLVEDKHTGTTRVYAISSKWTAAVIDTAIIQANEIFKTVDQDINWFDLFELSLQMQQVYFEKIEGAIFSN